MTRGGKRPGAGRPVADYERKTASLSGVRVLPSKLERWKQHAESGDTRFTDWVEMALDEMMEREEEFVKRIDKLRKSKSWPKE